MEKVGLVLSNISATQGSDLMGSVLKIGREASGMALLRDFARSSFDYSNVFLIGDKSSNFLKKGLELKIKAQEDEDPVKTLESLKKDKTVTSFYNVMSPLVGTKLSLFSFVKLPSLDLDAKD